jgi:hypothetical protein
MKSCVINLAKTKNFLIKSILICYLFASYIGATHIHNDYTEHHDCKICIVVKNLNGNNPSILDIPCVISYYYIPDFILNLVDLTIIKGFNSNAPPLFF